MIMRQVRKLRIPAVCALMCYQRGCDSFTILSMMVLKEKLGLNRRQHNEIANEIRVSKAGEKYDVI